MFYVMYVSCKEPLKAIFSKITNSDMIKTNIVSENDSELVALSDAFTLRVSRGGNNTEFASEDYSAEFDFCFWFEVISSYPYWAEDLMQFVDSTLTSTAGDLVLESNGDKPILHRTSNTIYVDKNLGDGSFPFDRITHAYIEKPLQRI